MRKSNFFHVFAIFFTHLFASLRRKYIPLHPKRIKSPSKSGTVGANKHFVYANKQKEKN